MFVFDTVRLTYNLMNRPLNYDYVDAEYTASTSILDLLSNGFKLRGNWNSSNASGGTYIYMAFAENPTKYALAR